jgi:hypothetical protein
VVVKTLRERAAFLRYTYIAYHVCLKFAFSCLVTALTALKNEHYWKNFGVFFIVTAFILNFLQESHDAFWQD